MTQFNYTATNPEGQRLSGIINAENKEKARLELNNLGFSILTLAEIQIGEEPSFEKTEEIFEKFEFEALDKLGKKIIGTIPARSRLAAYKRLVEEYHFKVAYLTSASASPQEKEKSRQMGTLELSLEYEKDKQIEKPPQKEAAEFELERQKLLKQVDFILAKLSELLDRFKDEIKPENKQIIKAYIDKLFRIKSSTNLPYIQHTCQELLKKIQDQEIFLHKEKNLTEKQRFLLETQRWLLNLSKVKEIHFKFWEKLKPLFQKIKGKLHLPPPDPEVADLKIKIKTTQAQIFEYLKIWLRSPRETKKEAHLSLKKLREQKKKFKEQLKTFLHQKKVQEKRVKEKGYFSLTKEFNTLSGWLLLFYLIYYFGIHYLSTKNLPFDLSFFSPLQFKNSHLLKYLITLVFLSHLATSLKIAFFRRNHLYNYFVLPLGFFLAFLIILNF